MEQQRAAVEEREAAFWDQAAQKRMEENLHVDEAALDSMQQRRLELLGDVQGKRVLDIGCGTGEWSVILARRGAEVHAVDISPASVEATQKRAEANGVSERVAAHVMSATDLDFDDGFFEVVHGQDIIHHLDPADFGKEMARVLSDEGHVVFSENSANNRLLMLARDHLCGRFGIPKWSSDDEYPLTRERRARFCQSFGEVSIEHPTFYFFFYLDAKIFKYKRPLVSRVCKELDQAIYTYLPSLRPYSYRQLIRCARPLRNRNGSGGVPAGAASPQV